jgi:hypothetical protein
MGVLHLDPPARPVACIDVGHRTSLAAVCACAALCITISVAGCRGLLADSGFVGQRMWLCVLESTPAVLSNSAMVATSVTWQPC